MERIPSLLMAVAMLCLAAPTTADDADEIQFADGNVFLRHEFAPLDHKRGSVAEFACSSSTADTYVFTGSDYCNTGGHSTTGGTLVMGFNHSQPGLTGMLEHVLSHAAGEVRFNCTWSAGSFTGCRIVSITWPPLGAGFCHELWGHAGAPGLDWHAPNTPPCDTTIGAGGIVVTTNAPSGGSGKPIGPWSASISHG